MIFFFFPGDKFYLPRVERSLVTHSPDLPLETNHCLED